MASTRVAIITGSSKGIGATIAERLAGDGMSVVINCASGAKPRTPSPTGSLARADPRSPSDKP